MRTYVDTSVFGGVFDEEFERASKIFFEQAEKGLFEICISPVTIAELDLAPDFVRNFLSKKMDNLIELPVTSDCLKLQSKYLEYGIMTAKSSNDALHVAIATASGCPMIISWNFKHIVHHQKIPLFNLVNTANGFLNVGIYSPPEVIQYEN